MTGNIYESDRLVREYLLFHYGSADEVLPHSFGPRDAVDFPARTVRELLDPGRLHAGARALDLGCAVGRSSFELSAFCGEVTGIDFSHAFIGAAETIRTSGAIEYDCVIEGDRTGRRMARVPDGCGPSRVRFAVGDAMDLPADLGAFDVVLAANLLCRLPDPRVFLARLPGLVKPGGQLLMTTPFTWLEEFTPKENWIGGREGADSAEELQRLLSPHFELDLTREMPFLIRETARKFQWSVARGARWIRK